MAFLVDFDAILRRRLLQSFRATSDGPQNAYDAVDVTLARKECRGDIPAT